MEDVMARSETEEVMLNQPLQDLESEAEYQSRRIDAIEDTVRNLENALMGRLVAAEERVQELERRMANNYEMRPEASGDISTMLPDVTPGPPLPRWRKPGALTTRRVNRRYKRLVKSEWEDTKNALRRIRKLKKKRRQRM